MTICAACGNNVAAEDRFCRVCGRPAASAPPSAVGTHPAEVPETSGKAIISLICSLLFFIPLAFIAAIVFGHLAISEIRRSAGRLKGQGIAITGLVLGYLWIVFVPVILIIAAIAIPNLLRARMAANESSAVASIRTLVVAEVSYSAAHGDLGFTCSLSDLEKERLINSQLARGQRNGYRFELVNCSPGESGGANAKYQVVAHPRIANQSGVRAFCADESGVIRVDFDGSSQASLETGSTLK
jgi:type IV pilus assembly protein PilA